MQPGCTHLAFGGPKNAKIAIPKQTNKLCLNHPLGTTELPENSEGIARDIPRDINEHTNRETDRQAHEQNH